MPCKITKNPPKIRCLQEIPTTFEPKGSLAYPRPTAPIIPFPITLRCSKENGTVSNNSSASPKKPS